MKQSIGDIVSDLIGNVTTYVNSKIELYTLSIFEKIAKVNSTILSAVVLILISFFCLFFITVSLAIWLGSLMDNYALGFLIVSLGYFFLGLIFIIFRRTLIDKRIFKNMVKAIFPDENKK
jgi:hypothetical protein